MLGKVKTGIIFLTLLVMVSGYANVAQPTVRATITPIVVNTLSNFNSPMPIFTRPPTSTAMPNTPTPIFTATITLTPSPTYTASPTLPNPPTLNPSIKFPKNLTLDEWAVTDKRYPYYGQFLDQVEGRYKYSNSEDDYNIFPNPLVQGFLHYDNSIQDPFLSIVYSKVMLNGLELVAKEEDRKTKSTISVSYNGNEISRIDTGKDIYAHPKIWGLWTYQDQWVLEYISTFDDPYGRQYPLGNIVWNGKSLNHKFGYQESFGLSAIDGRIFYFFRRNNQIGISYDGIEYNLGYESVDHYGCCEWGTYRNPQRLGWSCEPDRNIRFFAERNGIEYLVVIRTK